MSRLSGAQIVWECLQREGVEVVFGYPGGCNLPLYDVQEQFRVRHVLVRHEQNAGHAADGYARATGKVGVAFGTSGPGATNLVTAVATAMLDSIPVVFITGQVPRSVIGSDAFQETDVTGVTLPITKYNYLVTRVEDVARTLREAFHLARSGRPGPVLVDIPKDVLQETTDFVWPEGDLRRQGEKLLDARRRKTGLERAAELIAQAKRPLILAGQGVLASGATEELQAFAEKTGTPVALTLLGLDSMPSGHPLRLAMMGMHGEAFVNRAVQSADLLLAFGMRFDDRVTGNLRSYAPNARKIHVDIDAAELNKNVTVDVAINADLKETLLRLIGEVQPAQHGEWVAEIQSWREDTVRRNIALQDTGDKLFAPQAIHDFWELVKDDEATIVTTDVGQHQMWVAQYVHPKRPRSLIWSGGLGTMGFGVPSAMGASLGVAGSCTWAVVGDGGFQMSIPELATMVQEKIPVKIVVINNHFLGMVRQWQELFYDKRYSATPLFNPDFTKLAEAYGITGIKVERRGEIAAAVRRARETEGPVLMEIVVEREDMVYPMVPTGTDLGTMIRRPMRDGGES